jgi:hypothetical protein
MIRALVLILLCQVTAAGGPGCTDFDKAPAPDPAPVLSTTIIPIYGDYEICWGFVDAYSQALSTYLESPRHILGATVHVGVVHCPLEYVPLERFETHLEATLAALVYNEDHKRHILMCDEFIAAVQFKCTWPDCEARVTNWVQIYLGPCHERI